VGRNFVPEYTKTSNLKPEKPPNT